MTKVSYLVKKNGFKGFLTVSTLVEARRKAQQIGGYYETAYSEVGREPIGEKDKERIAKRLTHFGIAY